VRAAECPRRFTLLRAGGVRTTYACGAQVVSHENAVDVAVLEDRVPRVHHHPHLIHRPR